MIKKSIFICMVLLLLLGGLTVSWGRGKKEPVQGKATESAVVKKVILRFSWWGTKERHDATLAAVDLWNKENPNIQVECYFSGWEGYHNKLGTQFAGKNAPDIFQFTILRYKEYSFKKLLHDLSSYMDTAFKGIDKGLWSRFLEDGDGKTYAVSTGVNATALVYNKTKLNEFDIPLPTDDETWDSLLEKCKSATRDTDGDGKVDFWGIMDPLDHPIGLMETYLRQHGIEMYTEDLRGSNFDDPKLLEALQKWTIFMSSGVCVPPEVTLASGQSYIGSGYTAFALNAVSTFPGTHKVAKDELDLVAFPKLGGGKIVSEVSEGLPMGIYSGSKHKDEAIQFLSWLMTDPAAGKLLGMSRGILPSKAQRDAIADNLSDVEKKMIRVVDEIASYGVDRGFPHPKHVAEFIDIFTQEKDKYNFGMLSLEEFVKQIMKNADPVLDQD